MSVVKAGSAESAPSMTIQAAMDRGPRCRAGSDAGAGAGAVSARVVRSGKVRRSVVGAVTRTSLSNRFEGSVVRRVEILGRATVGRPREDGPVCGRYASFREAQDLADAFAIDAALVTGGVRELAPSWNVAPTDDVRVVVERARRPAEPGGVAGPVERSLRLARWGLVPSWAKDPSVGNRMINARVESLQQKSAFAKPFAARRCLVPADGYYEWRVLEPIAGTASSGTASSGTASAGTASAGTASSGRARPPKQPYYIAPADGDVAALAGLYEFWRDRTRADDDPRRWLVTATIITRPASDDLAAIHERMPLALPRDAWDAWLDPATGAAGAAELLGTEPERMRSFEVSSLVSSVANDSPALIEPAQPR
jgi:putative SOS response-associated peptidase YedK